MKKSFLLLFLLIIFICTFIGNISPVSANSQIEPKSFIAPDGESYVFDLKWGSYGTLNDELSSPIDLAVDTSGNIWATDSGNNRIIKFDSSGNFLLTVGATGAGPGQLNAPQSVDVDSGGNIWVADYNNGRVQKLNSSGQQICQIAGLSQPVGVAVDRNTGNVFVSNNGTDNIIKLDSTCAIIGVWGGPGSGKGQFNNPHSVAVDNACNVYVADYSNYRIQKFDCNGGFITMWGVGGSGDSRFTLSPEFNGPLGIEVDPAGDVFVVDHLNHRIQKFKNDGTFITTWGWYGAGNGQFNYPWGVAIDGQGRVYIADRDNHRIQRFSPSNTNQTQLYKGRWGSYGSADGQFYNPHGTVTDRFGNVYVAELSNNRIQEFDSNGVFLRKWGTTGAANGQFSGPHGITIDNTGNIYVIEYYNHRIQKFDSTGVFLMGIGHGTVWSAPTPAPPATSGTGNGWFKNPTDVAVDPTTGDIYVADFNNFRIQVFNSAGIFLRGIGNGTTWSGTPPAPLPGNLNKWFNRPYGITLDAAANIYVGEYDNNRIQKLDYLGNFLAKWGSSGAGNGQFSGPRDITVDSAGNVYVADGGNHRIQKFDPLGRFISKWSSNGNGVGQLSSPWGLVFDPTGDFLYVTEVGNHRMQKFERFGFSFVATPNTKTVGSGDIAAYSIDVSGDGQNTLGTTVSFYVLSGLPAGTTWSFAPSSVTPNSSGIVSSTLSLDTSPTTPVGTYTVYVEAEGGGQTRIIPVTLNVIPNITNFTANPNPFNPNKNYTTITADFTTPLTWTLDIRKGSCTGALVRTFAGSGPSLSQVWDGKNNGDSKVPDGIYCYLLNGKDAGNVYANQVSFTNGTVDTVKPVLSFVSDAPDPFQHHLGQTTTINYTLSEKAYVTIKIYSDPCPRPRATTMVRTLVNNVQKPAGSNSVIWNGKDNSKVLVPNGTYSYKITAVDVAGNKAASACGDSTAE